MTKEELKHIEETITKEIAHTEVSIANYKELTKPIAPENAIGRISRMDAINNKSVNEAALRASIEKMKNLKHALSIIDLDDFGNCIRCHKEIPFGRLLVMPESDKCIECARLK